MHVLISADMEGATGVTCPDDCRPGSPQWDRFRHLLTADVNAVATGFLAAGVESVTVNEAHSTMRNVLLEELDPRVRLLTGQHKDFGMMEGIQRRPDLVAFVGYHSAPGTPGVLSHTYLGCEITEVTLNDRPMSEGYLNALLAAEYGAAVVLVSGDDLTCADARDYAPAARCVQVKEAVDRYSAICRTPGETSAELHTAATEAAAITELATLPDPPFVCRVEFLGTSSAAAAALIPTVDLVDHRTVRFSAETMHDLHRCFSAVATLGASAVEQTYG